MLFTFPTFSMKHYKPNLFTHLQPELLQKFLNGFDHDHRAFIDAGAEPAHHAPHIFRIQVFLPERVGLALFGFGFMNAATLSG